MNTVTPQLKEAINNYIGWKHSNIKSKETNPNIDNVISLILKDTNEQLTQINYIITVINDYISTTDIPFKQSSMSLLLDIASSFSELSQQSLDVIINLVNSSFKDITCVPFSTKIIYTLYTKYSYWKEKITNIILKTYTGENLNIPAYNQETRYHAIKLLNEIISEQSLDKNQQINILSVAYDCIDGEKDPRNLLIAFNLVKLLYMTIPKDISDNYTKNYFEFLNEYYPIDFTPPKDVKNPITAKQLSNAVNEVICIENFASYFFDNINEYGVSSVGDIMITLQSISETYSHELLSKYYTKIIDFIINSIQNNDDEAIHIESLITLTRFLKHYSPYDSQIEKTYEFLSDKIFSEEEIKNSYDSKDIICSIIEYDINNTFLEKSIQLIIKLISLFIFRKSNYHFLKNANSILFFALKKFNNKDKSLPNSIIEIFQKNKQMFISLIKDNSLYENNINTNSTYNAINIFICIVDIIAAICVKTDIFTKEEAQIIYQTFIEKYFDMKIEKEKEKDIEHLAYCICELCNKYDIMIYENIFAKYKNDNDDNINSLKCLKVLHNLLKIYNDDTKRQIFNFFISNIISKNIQIIFVDLLKENYKEYENILKEMNDKIEKIIFDNITNKEYYDLISILIEKQPSTLCDKVILILLDNLSHPHIINLIKKCVHRITNKEYVENILTKLDSFYFNKDNTIDNKLRRKICKCIFELLHLSKDTTKSKIKASLIQSITTINIDSISKEELIIKEIYLSSIINFIVMNDFKSNEENKEIDNIIQSYFNMINQSKHEGVFEVSKLFKIKSMSSDIKYYLLMKLKPYNTNNKYLNIILNVYTSSPEEDSETESDILFTLFSKCLLHNINIKNAIIQLRKILIANIDNLQFKRIDSKEYYTIAYNILNYLTNSNLDDKLKIESIKLIGVIKDFISEVNLTEDQRKSIIIPLRKILCDRKRQVRKICGIVINIWSSIE